MYKNILVGLLVLLTTAFVFAADEETLIKGDVEHGGYGGPLVKFGQIHGDLGVAAGGKGGWIINHTFSIGGAGYGFSNDIIVGKDANGKNLYLHAGYGGFLVEYISNSDDLIHTTYSLLIGAGGANVSLNRMGDIPDPEDKSADAFFVVEPEVNLDVNITKWMRGSVGAGYRFVSGVNLPGVSNSDLAGPTLQLVLKFGKF